MRSISSMFRAMPRLPLLKPTRTTAFKVARCFAEESYKHQPPLSLERKLALINSATFAFKLEKGTDPAPYEESLTTARKAVSKELETQKKLIHDATDAEKSDQLLKAAQLYAEAAEIVQGKEGLDALKRAAELFKQCGELELAKKYREKHRYIVCRYHPSKLQMSVLH